MSYNIDGVSNILPVGAIMPYFGTTAPAGWLLCNGGIVTTAYPALRAHLIANGSFTVVSVSPLIFAAIAPNLRDKFIVGAGSAYPLADTGGDDTVTLIPSQVPLRSHTHDNGTLATTGAGAHSHAVGFTSQERSGGETGTDAVRSYPGVDGVYYTNTESNHTHPITGDTGTPNVPEVPGAPHENRPPYYALTYIIKT